MTIGWLYPLAGLLVGLLVGMTGVGGGSLMTPVLVLAFGFHPATAVGTDLLYASVTKLAGTSVHGLHDTVDWRIVRRLAAGSLPAALITLLILWATHSKSSGGGVISVVLGIALILTAIGMVFRRRIVERLSRQANQLREPAIGRLTVLLGAVLGALVTLTSVGAGALGMTALLVLYPRAPVARLVGSDIAHAVPLTLLAGIGHLTLGEVNLPLLGALLIGSIPGIIIGSLIATRVSDRILAPLLAIVLAIVGFRLVWPS